MNTVAILVFLSFAACSVARAPVCPEDHLTLPPVQVRTSKGLVQGATLNVSRIAIPGSDFRLSGVGDVFRGIPFAEPPVGARRLQPAVEKQAWTGTVAATKFSKMCPQHGDANEISEDCLYLNVITPRASTTKAYPVMFFIYGGGFRQGNCNACPWGTVANLVRHDVIVVCANYRVGFLGFFTTKTSDYPANLGLRDQVLALKWVQSEIHNFGGDPNKVTVFGSSAGGYSTDFHTYSPMSRGLFHQAIMQSGTARMPLAIDGNDFIHNPSKAAAMKFCHITSNEWDAGNFTKLAPCLRNTPWPQIVSGTEGISTQGWKVWPAVIDGEGGFLPKQLSELAKERVHDMPVIIGTSHDEMSFLYILEYAANHNTLTTWTKQLYRSVLSTMTTTEQYGENAHIVRRIVDQHYRPNGQEPAADDHVGWLKLIAKLESDKYFFAPALRQAQEWLDVSHNPNVRMYSFDYASPALAKYYPPGYKPVIHSEASLYIFILPLLDARLLTAEDLEIIFAMGLMWSHFAKHGTPSGDGFYWRSLSHSYRSSYYSINTPFPTNVDHYWPRGTHLWNERVPHITKHTRSFLKRTG